jgi:hypothetical protein
MTDQEPRDLRPGDMIGRPDGITYIVTAKVDGRAIAVHTVEVTEPSGWVVLRRSTPAI